MVKEDTRGYKRIPRIQEKTRGDKRRQEETRGDKRRQERREETRGDKRRQEETRGDKRRQERREETRGYKRIESIFKRIEGIIGGNIAPPQDWVSVQ